MNRYIACAMGMLLLSLGGCGRAPMSRTPKEELPQGSSVLVFRLVHPMNDSWVARLRDENRAPSGYRWLKSPGWLARDPGVDTGAKPEAGVEGTWLPFAVPESVEFMLETNLRSDGGREFIPRFVETAVHMTGASIESATLNYDYLKQPTILIRFTRAGRRQFADLTRAYAPRGSRNEDEDWGRQLAIIVDGRLLSAPFIQSEVPGGQAEITGIFTEMEVRRWVDLINRGR